MSPCKFTDIDEEHETRQIPADPNQQNIRTAYTELCTSYRAIDDFRAKLLGFLPLASGTGIFLSYSTQEKYLLPIGIFGFIITLGLFAYEIYGIKKCHCLILTGKYMERKMSIGGQFCYRPRAVKLPIFGRVLNEPLASGIIYPAVLAAWTFLALTFSVSPIAGFSSAKIAGMIAVLIFSVFFYLTMKYNKGLRFQTDMKKFCKDEAETAS